MNLKWILSALSAVLLTALLLSFAACDGGESPDTTPASPDTVPQEVSTEAVTAPTTEATTEIVTLPETEEETTVRIIYETVQNPVAPAGGDPWVIRHGDKYYYC